VPGATEVDLVGRLASEGSVWNASVVVLDEALDEEETHAMRLEAIAPTPEWIAPGDLVTHAEWSEST
jgi:hypothetical protein